MSDELGIIVEALENSEKVIKTLWEENQRLTNALTLINNIAFAGKDYQGGWRDDIYSVCQHALNPETSEGNP